MQVTPDTVADQHEWVRERAPEVVALANRVRADFSEIFETDVDPLTEPQYCDAVDRVFADGELAVNVATMVALLRDLDVTGDYPGFVVDELLGRELAGAIAGNQPLGMLGEAAFHYADIAVETAEEHPTGAAEPAGADDLDAALAAGFQTRLPGWNWRERPSPFGVDTRE